MLKNGTLIDIVSREDDKLISFNLHSTRNLYLQNCSSEMSRHIISLRYTYMNLLKSQYRNIMSVHRSWTVIHFSGDVGIFVNSQNRAMIKWEKYCIISCSLHILTKTVL